MTDEKVLTEEGRFFLEQTATLYPKLKEFLDEQNNIFGSNNKQPEPLTDSMVRDKVIKK